MLVMLHHCAIMPWSLSAI